MTDTRDVLEQMQAAGIPELPSEIIADGRRRYFGRKKKSYYRISEFNGSAGRVLVGAFGRYGGADAVPHTKIRVDWSSVSQEERLRRRALMAEQIRLNRERDQQLRAAAANRSRILWRTAKRLGTSPYLERKGVAEYAEAVKYLANGTVVVPMIRYDLEREDCLKGVQRILPDGEKLYTKDCEKPGTAVRLGAMSPTDHVAIICEGYATGLSIRAAVERRVCVWVAFDAGNLLLVGHVVRKLYPDVRLLFAADDDYLTIATRRGQVTNPGKTKAWLAARELGRADICLPVFRQVRTEKLTDYNDWHKAEGLEPLREHFRRILERVGT